MQREKNAKHIRPTEHAEIAWRGRGECDAEDNDQNHGETHTLNRGLYTDFGAAQTNEQFEMRAFDGWTERFHVKVDACLCALVWLPVCEWVNEAQQYNLLKYKLKIQARDVILLSFVDFFSLSVVLVASNIPISPLCLPVSLTWAPRTKFMVCIHVTIGVRISCTFSRFHFDFYALSPSRFGFAACVIISVVACLSGERVTSTCFLVTVATTTPKSEYHFVRADCRRRIEKKVYGIIENGRDGHGNLAIRFSFSPPSRSTRPLFLFPCFNYFSMCCRRRRHWRNGNSKIIVSTEKSSSPSSEHMEALNWNVFD